MEPDPDGRLVRRPETRRSADLTTFATKGQISTYLRLDQTRHAPGMAIGMLSTRPLEVWALRGWMLTVTAVIQRLRHRWRALDTARRRRNESWRAAVRSDATLQDAENERCGPSRAHLQGRYRRIAASRTDV